MAISSEKNPCPARMRYMIKTFGATVEDFRFSRLPMVVQKARAAIPDDDVGGFLICALERFPKMTGLMFCDHRKGLPRGLPAHTPPIVARHYREGYLVVETLGGGVFVVAQWYSQNGALGPFFSVQ